MARRKPEAKFTSLAHYLTVALLRRAYDALEADAAPGVDGMTKKEYGRDLERNLKELHERLKTGRYRAKPVLRRWIEKPDGGRRPLGIPTVEDKIVQGAVVVILNSIYEADFYGFSYGYRPGRGSSRFFRETRSYPRRWPVSWGSSPAMPGVYRPRHPERTALYRVLFHYFDRFLSEYESRFQREYGFFRPIIKEVVFVIPKMLRIFFKYKRRLLGDLCRAAVLALLKYLQATTGSELIPGVVAVIQSFGQKMNFHPHIHLLASAGGEDGEGTFHRVTDFQDSLLSAFFKREVFALLLGEELISEDLVEKIAGWRHSGFSVHSKVRAKTREEAERVGKYMIRPVLSLERLSLDENHGRVCYRYGEGQEEVERMDDLEFIAHLKLTCVAERPPPPHLAYQELLMPAETQAEYFS
ncbi:MAG: transposase [Candidatus Aminicenantales bacterium]